MYSKILVPLDGSTLAEKAIEPALALGDSVVLLRANILDSLGLTEPSFMIDDLLDHQDRSIKGYLDRLSEELGPRVSVRTMREDAATAILETAVQEGVDLIVLTSHGRTGLSRWMFGSVADKVLRHAECPVLVIKPGT